MADERDPTVAAFRLSGAALDDLLAIQAALRLLEREPVTLEAALADALLHRAETLTATVVDPFNAMIANMRPRPPTGLAA